MVFGFGGCGCDGGKKKPTDGGLSTGEAKDAGDDAGSRIDAGKDAGAKKAVKKPDAGVKPDAGSSMDAGADAGNPFAYDAAADYKKDPGISPGDPPAAWTCPKALWADHHCDCGCGDYDFDCTQGTSCIEPGCTGTKCDACFTLSGSWKSCMPDPDPAAWSCSMAAKGDGVCDCGCGIPDPECFGQGCSEPGCRTAKCQVRHGCSADMIAAHDDCSSANPKILTDGVWRCPWDRYASGDGCDCGCGAADPDCQTGGCSGARCFEAACVRCSDELGRPYSCDAAGAGWDDDILGGTDTKEPSQCLSSHFGTGDGCDCGCGGHDPDCGDGKGCDEPGCSEATCKRCTNATSLRPQGCAPGAWTDTYKCNAESYGTGDGCDCGCGSPDPDCDGKGCTTPGCTDVTCDVCNDGSGKYVKCPGWVCTDDTAWGTAQCDCGCGVVDPFCRDSHRESCTEPGCSTAACQYCNDTGGVRDRCPGWDVAQSLGPWESGNGGTSSQCSLSSYGVDGLCDCGCGAADPDCASGDGCKDQGCNATGCDVCHDGALLAVCRTWTCDPKAFGSGDGCDCGCGAPDPDCAGAGCFQPGCKDMACSQCHDPFGRALPCP